MCVFVPILRIIWGINRVVLSYSGAFLPKSPSCFQAMNRLRTVLFVLYVFKFGLSSAQAPLITIPDGQLRGTANRTLGESVSYYAYRGIPFAKKPIGELRFAAPVKNDPWTGILNATADKDRCTQLDKGLAIFGNGSNSVVGSEDCLYINVYTTNVNGSLPVMVWIYGGGFYGGSSDYNTYNPDNFLEKGVVYVAFNYRLGIFGFLSTEDLKAPGNWGLKDQILALKWVKQNIAHFGGDPEKITIFGESAGSASVAYLLQTPKTQGLYGGAIMQSGSSLSAWALTRNPRKRAFLVGLALGIITLSSETLVQQLRKVDYRTLKLAESNVTTLAIELDNLLNGLPFGIVKEPDHAEAVFSSSSWELLKNGNFQRVPLLMGFNSEEAAAAGNFLDLLKPIIRKYDINKALLVPPGMTQNSVKRYLAGLAISNHFFHLLPATSQPAAIVSYISVEMFVKPIREAVVLASRYTKVYCYEFGYNGLLGDPQNSSAGAAHAEELPYLFTGTNQNLTHGDLTTSQRLVAFWTNFAKTWNPTPQGNSQNGTVLGNLTWIPNDSHTNVNTSIEYLSINGTLAMSTNPFQYDWTFYEGLYSKYGDPPYTTY